jgi:hypothetical protein
MAVPRSGFSTSRQCATGDPRKDSARSAVLRHHGLQVGHQRAEHVDALRADRLHFRGAGRVLGREPRLLAIDVEVGAVRERHDLAHRGGIFESLPGFHDAGARVRELTVERCIRQLAGEPAAVRAVYEARAAARDVDELADEVRVDSRRELLEVHVDVLEARAELGRQEIAEVLGRQVLEVALRGHEGAARLRHLLAVHGQEPVRVHGRGLPEASALERRRPEQRVEIEDVLADEVVQLVAAVRLPPVLEIQPCPGAVVGEGGHVTDRRVEPDVEILARRIRDLETEVRRVARDVPVAQARLEPFVELVGDRVLQRSGPCPGAQHRLEVAEAEEHVLGLTLDRRTAGDDRDRVNQVRG